MWGNDNNTHTALHAMYYSKHFIYELIFFLTIPLEIDTIILVLQIKKLRPDMLTCPRIHSGAKIQTWEVML